MFATISRSVSLWTSRRCSSSIRLPVNRYRLSFCTAPFVRRVLASVIHHRYGTITIFCRPITRSSRTKGNRETTGVATLSRLFSISSSQGCSVFLRRSVEFKGMKYRSFYFFSLQPSDYRLGCVPSALDASFTCSRRFAIKYLRSSTSVCVLDSKHDKWK